MPETYFRWLLDQTFDKEFLIKCLVNYQYFGDTHPDFYNNAWTLYTL